MSPTSVSPAPRPSNVYYLAPSVSPARIPKLSRGLVLRLRLLSFYWRVKLTAAETWDALRRFGRPEAPADSTFLEQRAEMILAAPPRPLGPARVIDFDAARVR